MIAEIAQLPFDKRISTLIEKNIISDVVLGKFSCGIIRPIVVINIDGIKQPFYRSANGSGYKERGVWHAFFGFGKDRHNAQLSWMIKGTLRDIETNYMCPAIEYYRNFINETLNWQHSLDLSGENPYFNPYTTFTGTMAEFNKLVYGESDRHIIWGESANKIASDITKLNCGTFPIEK